jgi:hypothetical protein
VKHLQKRRWVARFLSTCTIAFGLVSLSAQSRVSDKDLENLMRNLRDDAKSFRPVFKSALKKSAIRKTSREKDAEDLATRFEGQTDAMWKRFKDKRKADAELGVVRNSAQQIDEIVRTQNLSSQAGSRWDKIQTELGQVLAAYGIDASRADDNPRGISNGAYASNAACSQAVGQQRADRMVQDCLAVSPATHPPCNARNSCSLIIDEIKRGCSLLEVRNAPAFCKEYR